MQYILYYEIHCRKPLGMIKSALVFILFISFHFSNAQHIQYRDKKKPVPAKTDASVVQKIPVAEKVVKVLPKDTVVVKEDTSNAVKSRKAFTMNPRLKKPYVEEQNMCDLLSKPEVAPTLPLVINNVSPKMVAMLKKRYAGRLYSITGLNMFDERLKYKLKICDKDLGKFRSEYLDKDGNVVTDPDFDYN